MGHELLRRWPDWDWPLRLAFAGVFLPHGVRKLIALPAYARILPLPEWMILGVGLMEVSAAVLVVAGAVVARAWLSRAAGLLILPLMLGAVFWLHWGQWHFAASATHPAGGMEFPFVMLMLATWFAVSPRLAFDSAGDRSLRD